mmetsp:Transcript_40911/g.80054  ORF Transcript_40911/g.80054 Transcript_40911/m.80054 type:complete len:85 (+) Transcript_40911:1531-1785(+)
MMPRPTMPNSKDLRRIPREKSIFPTMEKTEAQARVRRTEEVGIQNINSTEANNDVKDVTPISTPTMEISKPKILTYATASGAAM